MAPLSLSMSSLLLVVEDRRRWAAITAEASVGVPQRRLDVTGFDRLIDLVRLAHSLSLVYVALPLLHHLRTKHLVIHQ